MPEGDTVLRTARRLHAALAGEPLTRCELRWGALDGSGLVDATTLEVVSRGKHLLHRVDTGWTIHSHLRMEGSWRIQRSESSHGDATRQDVRAIVSNWQWCAVGLRLGMLDLLPTRHEDQVVGHLGPDVLGQTWDLETALDNVLRDGSQIIGSALLDQRNVAGIGTLYASESLFLERLHPWASVDVIGPDAVRRVLTRAHRLMSANVDHAVQSTTGDRQRGREVYVHARMGLPCRRCGDQIRVASLGAPPTERVFFSCPTCQGGRAPTDDGRSLAPLGARRGRTERHRNVEGS